MGRGEAGRVGVGLVRVTGDAKEDGGKGGRGRRRRWRWEKLGKKGKGDKGGKGEGAFGLSCCLKGQDNLVYVTTRIKIVLISKF